MESIALQQRMDQATDEERAQLQPTRTRLIDEERAALLTPRDEKHALTATPPAPSTRVPSAGVSAATISLSADETPAQKISVEQLRALIREFRDDGHPWANMVNYAAFLSWHAQRSGQDLAFDVALESLEAK